MGWLCRLNVLPIEVLSVGPADAVQRQGVDATVHECEAEAHDAESVPEGVVIILCTRTENKLSIT